MAASFYFEQYHRDVAYLHGTVWCRQSTLSFALEADKLVLEQAARKPPGSHSASAICGSADNNDPTRAAFDGS